VRDATIVTGLRSSAATGTALALAGTVVSLATGHLGDLWASHLAVAAVVTVGLCAVVWIVAPHQPRNASVWAMTAASLGGLSVLTAAMLPFLTEADPGTLRHPHYVPADHPRPVALVTAVVEVASTIGVFVPVTLGLLLFPTGSLPRRRWRWVARCSAGSIGAVCVAYVIANRPAATRNPERWIVLGVAQLAVLAAMAISIVAVVGRLRSCSGDARQQVKWVLWGAAVAAVALVTGTLLVGRGDRGGEWLAPLLVFTGFTVMIGAYGVAMARYRLYDVDLVISRTIVYAALAAVVTGVYVGAVVGVGSIVGAGGEPHAALAIASTAVVAAVFQPLRRRLQRLVDRLVYGRRATPHEVLSAFAERVAANDDQLVEQVARSLVDGTGAVAAEVWVTAPGAPHRVAAWPGPGAHRAGESVTFTAVHRGAELGSLVLWLPVGQRLPEQDRRLAEQVASGLGLALRNRTLTTTLERRVAELRQSRRRVVAVQDEIRRRIERDLHDGSQQQLVAIRVKLGLACALAERSGSPGTLAAVRELLEHAERVIESMREFARGVYPPLLEADGLRPVVAAQARRLAIPVAVETSGLGRYDREVESTVHVCVTEALRNVARHAGARSAWVRVGEVAGAVRFEVGDDGAGFDVDATPRGAGLTNLADRLAALGGALTVSSAPGAGTLVAGTIPAGAGGRGAAPTLAVPVAVGR